MTKKIEFLSLTDLIEIGTAVVADFRIRDVGLLESAANRPQTSVFGEDAYPEFPNKVAALIHSIARNHALIDGNKRLAWAAGRIFCLMNDFDIAMTHDEAYDMIIGAAAGDLDVANLSAILTEKIISQTSQ
ncbi:MAG: type II toxin-antitoxin system death-on-curing family toxin [Actinomycetales bacterium]|nr:type II toxin-antitoxin system death-on-curing family toxin [Actinomycetales bacterium]